MASLAAALPSPAHVTRGAPRAHPFRRLLRRRGAAVGLVIVAFFVLLAVLAPVVSPYDPLATSWTAIRKAPNTAHWFGTDEIGRDVLSRVVWGARASLLAGVVSVLISLSIGVPVGLFAGALSGWLRARPGVLTWVFRSSGAILVGLGIKLAFERR